MTQFTPTKIIFLITLIIGVILSIVSLGMNKFIGSSFQTDLFKVSVAFDIIGLLLTIAALVLFLILLFTCKEKQRLFSVVIVILTGVALLCFAISVGTAFHPATPSWESWLLATVWISVIVFVVSLIFTFGDTF
ncbi:hypothetical protein D915_004681 [Fasciola hepatica]|uniref:Uncharacterized protein n=1 Tax=Fasciola hepatica TaxID=6192 RepID=A0A4E0RZ91_FASHE|nr:hypothetical protein D915_004681 [Fasciola hepatica]